MSRKERLVSDLKLARDVCLNMPMVSVMGNCEAFIENFKSIVHYECDCIRVITKQGYISVEGRGLQIQYYTEEEISIKGVICKIEYF